MSLLRFSLTSCLVLMTVLGIVFAAVTTGTWVSARLFYTFAFTFNLVAILLAANRNGLSRSFWIGFAVFGLGYFFVRDFQTMPYGAQQLSSVDLVGYFSKSVEGENYNFLYGDRIRMMNSKVLTIHTTIWLFFSFAGGAAGSLAYLTRPQVKRGQG